MLVMRYRAVLKEAFSIALQIAAFSVIATSLESAVVADTPSPTAILSDAIGHDRALTRLEYLSLLVSSQHFEPALLVRALTSRDVATRRIAAFQIGELGPEEYPRLVGLLVQAAKDPDQGVSDQAIVSLIRVGWKAPAALLPLIEQTAPLRMFEYDSPSANSGRRVDITASDVAIAGLYYGRDVDLQTIIDAYSKALSAEALLAANGNDSTHELLDRFRDHPVEPGSSAYLANAIAALLKRSPDGHVDLISRLFDSPDPRLRQIAFDSAGRISFAKGSIAARLANVVRNSTDADDRESAADALAMLGADGRTTLIQLAYESDAKIRAAAFPGLLQDKLDCSSPFLMRALSDSDSGVRIATLKSMFGFRRGYWSEAYMPCLAPLVSDNSIDLDLRGRMLGTLNPGQHVNAKKSDISDVEDLIRILHPVLSDEQSELYEPAWNVVRDMLAGQQTFEPSIAEIALDRLRAGLTNRDTNLLCSLFFIAPKLLVSNTVLVGTLIGALEKGGIDESSRQCIEATLSKVDFGSAGFAQMSNRISDVLLAQQKLTDTEIELVEKLPEDLFTRIWRGLAQNRTGESRLAIYRIAASRGLAVDEAIALFNETLAAKTNGADDVGNLRYREMPAAVRGLAATGERGRAALRDLLKGQGGSALGREVEAIESTRLDQQTAISLVPGLIAATQDKDPGVRSAVGFALPRVLHGQALVTAMRPLFSDTDKDVLFKILDVIRQNGVSDPEFVKDLSVEDEQTIVKSLSKDLRDEIPSTLVTFGDRLPPRFVTTVLNQLLLDPDETVRARAVRSIGDLGPSGFSALEQALASPQVPNLFEALASGIARLRPAERQKVLPLLSRLREQYPDSAPLLKGLGAAAGNDAAVTSMMENALLSDRSDLRDAALETLSAQHFFASSSQLYLAALIEQQIGSHLQSYLGAVLEMLRPYTGMVPMSGSVETLPEFPWPPPTWSFKELVPRNFFDNDTSLGEVFDRLAAAVRAASPDYDYGLFGISGGFLMLARLERINPDGSPYPGRLRWDSKPIPPRSLDEYLVDLFFSPPGYFRVIAFAITGEEPIETQSNAELPPTSEGAKTLPDDIAKSAFAGRQVFALIYTFERYDGGKMSLNYEGSPSGISHLTASGIWGELKGLSASTPTPFR